MDIPTDMWTYKHTNRHINKCTNILMDIPTLQIPVQYAKRPPMSIPKCKKFCLFNANFPHLKVLEYYYQRTSRLNWE